jgi:hypothetical protein
MALRGLLEVVVHLESFRNIDLFYQGLYYLKVSLYSKKNEEVRPPSPIPLLSLFLILTLSDR